MATRLATPHSQVMRRLSARHNPTSSQSQRVVNVKVALAGADIDEEGLSV